MSLLHNTAMEFLDAAVSNDFLRTPVLRALEEEVEKLTRDIWKKEYLASS